MRITRSSVTRTCAICERTLLLGERVTRFSPDGSAEYVDVCQLCQEIALEHGWVKEGSPTTPTIPAERRRRRGIGSLLQAPRPALPASAAEPSWTRLSEPDRALVDAADAFNGSQYRRSVEGIAKSLGPPEVSIVALSGRKGEHVVTVAWDISWYQYRVSFDVPQQVRLAEKGLELDELEDTFRQWNAELSEDGRVVPDLLVAGDALTPERSMI